LEWLDGFDPVIFSIPQANALIGALFAWYLERSGKKLPGFFEF